MPDRQTVAPVISKSRLEFLFDGVFAIAMTLLVLELKVPELSNRHSTAELWQALAHNGPTFVSYLLSFIVLGIFWYRHNQQYHHFHFITRSMLLLHFVQLAAAGFFPFCAALLGRYPTNALTLTVYLGCTLVYAAASLANWVIARRHGSLGPEMAESEFRRSRNRLILWNGTIAAMLTMYLLKVLAR